MSKKRNSIRVTDTPDQIAAKAQALAEIGYNNSQIARELGVTRQWVAKLVREDLPEDWKIYRDGVKRWFFEQDSSLAELTSIKLREKLEAGQGKVSELAFLYKTARELQFPEENKHAQVNIDNRKVEIKWIGDEDSDTVRSSTPPDTASRE